MVTRSTCTLRAYETLRTFWLAFGLPEEDNAGELRSGEVAASGRVRRTLAALPLAGLGANPNRR